MSALGLRAGTAYVDILPKIGASFGNELERGMKGDVERVGTSTGSSIGSIFGKVAGIAAGALGAVGAVQVFKGFIDEGNEARDVANQTAAVLKSTGGAAHVSAKDVDTLSNAISKKVGIDDEAIASGENLLLTFTNIRNEAGKGNDVFNQATSVITDMSAALGQDMKSSAIQVGKALNDPIKGVTALQRVGVSFTEDQKKQIETLVKTGHTLDAQKLILRELNTEFGGSAASQATASKKLGVVWKNMQEQLGTALLPVIDKVANFLADKLPNAIAFLSNAFHEIAVPIGMFINTLRTGFTEDEGTPIEKIALIIRNDLIPVIREVAEFISEHLQPVLIGLGAAILLIVGGPIALIIGALVAAYIKFGWFRDAVNAVVRFFIDDVVPGITAAVGWLSDQFSHFADFVRVVWPSISEAIRHVVNVISDIIDAFIAVVTGAWHLFGDDILHIARAIWDQIRAVIDVAVNTIKDIIKVVLDVINGDWGKAWDAIKDLFGGVWDFMVRTVKNVGGILSGLIGGIFDGVRHILSEALDFVIGFWTDRFNQLVDYFKKLPGRFRDAAGDIFGFIRDAFKGAIDWVIRAWNHFELKMPEVDTHIPGIGKVGGFTLGTPDIPELATGGRLLTGGMVDVGERGRERLFLPAGALVKPLTGEDQDGGKHYHLTLAGVAYEPVNVAEQFHRMELLAP